MIQNSSTIFSLNKENISLALLLAFLAMIFSSALLIVVSLLFLIGFIFFNGEKLIYSLFIIILIALPGDINEGIRNAINIVVGFSLIFLFVKKKQFLFEQYLKLDTNLFRLILLILGSLIVSTLLSKNILVGFTEVLRQIVFFMIFYFFYSEFSERKNVFYILLSLVLSGVLVSFGVLYKLFSSGMELIYLELAGLGKSSGFYNNVSAVGGLLAVSIPLTVSFLSLEKGKRKGVKLLLITSIFFQAVALLATNSRAAMLSVAISLLLYSYLLSPKKLKKIFTLLIFAACIVFIIPGSSEVFNLYFRTGRILENTRYLLWDMAFSIISGNIFWGVGPGMFKYFMYPNLNVLLGSWEEHQIAFVYENAGAGHVHNFFLMRASELGLVGFVITLFFLAYILKTSFRLMKTIRSVSTELYIFSIIIFSIYIGLFFRSFFESTGILTNGWLSRDLPFWLLILAMLVIKSKTEGET